MPIGIDDLIFLGIIGAWWAWVNHEVQEKTDGQYSGFIDAITGEISKVIDQLLDSSDPVAPIFAGLLGTLKDAAEVFGYAIDKVAINAKDVQDLFRQTTTLALDALIDGQVKLKELNDAIKNLIENHIQANLNDASRKLDDLKDVVNEGLQKTVDNIGKQIGEGIDKVLDKIAENMHLTQAGLEWMNDYIDGALEGISQGINQGIENVTDRINEMIEQSLKGSEMIANAQVMSSLLLLDGLSRKIDDVVTPSEETLDKMIDSTLQLHEKMLKRQLEKYREIARDLLPLLKQGR